MTSVLKLGSTAGERYDSLFYGAVSLVNGLGSILRVVSHEASVYDSHSGTSLQYFWARRSERDASDAQLQVKIRSEIHVQKLHCR